MSVEPSRTILLINRSERRFESHTGRGKIRRTLKNDENFAVFCQFLAKADLKLFCSDQEKER